MAKLGFGHLYYVLDIGIETALGGLVYLLHMSEILRFATAVWRKTLFYILSLLGEMLI